jgi:predicted glycoside hydrolase/deacetylase ChbG (UPF0249 family)
LQRLIINADDFGMTEGINRAVADCHREGVVTSTTMLVNGGAVESARDVAAANPSLGVGLHLNLTTGAPSLPPANVGSLVDGDGLFPGANKALARLSLGLVNREELEREIAAQVEALRSMGLEPTHIDSHHHLHAHPVVGAAVARVCPRLGISKARGFRLRPRNLKAAAVRLAAALTRGRDGLKSPDVFAGIEVMGERDVAEYLERALKKSGDSLEYMCHPGYADEQLYRISTYNRLRQVELEALISPELALVIKRAGIELISFRDL